MLKRLFHCYLLKGIISCFFIFFLCLCPDRQTNRQAGRQAGIQEARQTYRQAFRQEEKQIERQKYIRSYICTDRQTDRERERDIHTYTDIRTDQQSLYNFLFILGHIFTLLKFLIIPFLFFDLPFYFIPEPSSR